MNKSVVITGVSAGIGKDLCSYFLDQGFKVIGIGRHKPAQDIEFFEQDLLDLDSLEDLGKKISKDYSPSFFIHNSMFSPGHKPFLRYKADDYQKAHTICSVAPALLLKHLAMGMRGEKFGRIVFMGSAVQLTGSTGQLVYLTAKSALAGLTKGLSLELAGSGVTVNQFLLGPVDTEKFRQNVDEQRRELIRKSLPTGEFVTTEQICQALDYVFSPMANAFTGQDLILASGLPGRK